MDKLFGSAPSVPAPAQQIPTGAANPGQALPGTQSTPQTAPNGMIPEQAPQKDSASPLAAFQDIWQTPTTQEGTPQALFANLDPQKVMESARKVDFAKGISPEQLQAIAAGGEGAVKAFAESMNSLAQSVYAQSAIATTKIVEQALGKAQEQQDARLPGMFKKLSSTENLQAANPLLSNPAIQPLVGALQEQLVRKNPNATAGEIQQQVSDYFAALGTSFAPKAPAPAGGNRKAKDEDWSAFLG